MAGLAFEPIDIGPLRLAGRLVRDPHTLSVPWSDENPAQCAYQAERARGGVAMCIIGGGAVHPSSLGPVPAHTDRVLPGLRAIADAVRTHGTRLVLQLRHSGSAKAN